jgi:hypothetical protein
MATFHPVCLMLLMLHALLQELRLRLLALPHNPSQSNAHPLIKCIHRLLLRKTLCLLFSVDTYCSCGKADGDCEDWIEASVVVVG